MTGPVEIREIPLPDALDAQDAADFVADVEVVNAVDSIAYGTPDVAAEPAEELHAESTPYRRSRRLGAFEGARLVGRAGCTVLIGQDSDTAWTDLHVLPEHAGRGIGRALADAIEQLAAEQPGVRKLVSYHGVPEAAGERMVPPTGFGSVPRDARAVRFALARGWSLEQVERVSRLALPVAGLDERLEAAAARSGPDYVVHTWTDRTPERRLADVATMLTRMSTDAPSAGLEEPEDVWTVERLASEEDRRRTSPRRFVSAAVEHRPSGRLVAFSDLSVPRQPHRAVEQWSTLVLREHRGHRLGMLVKLANLAHLARVAPHHPSVITFNAEENRPMLDVNEAIGFTPIAVEAGWRKDVS